MARINDMVLFFTSDTAPGQPGPIINYDIRVGRGQYTGRAGNHCVLRGRKFDHLQTLLAMLCLGTDQMGDKMTFWFRRQDYLPIRDQVYNAVDQ